MPEKIYSTADGLYQIDQYDKSGAVNAYKVDEDGKKTHVSRDEFAEYMTPGILEDRKKYREEHKEEEKEWKIAVQDHSAPEADVRIKGVKEKVGDLARKGLDAARERAEGLAGAPPLSEAGKKERDARIKEVFGPKNEDSGKTKEFPKVNETKLVSAEEYKEQHSEETEDGFPLEGVLDGDESGAVVVEKTWGVGDDGQIYYKVEGQSHGVSANRLKFKISETDPTKSVTEVIPPKESKAEEEKELSFKERSAHPETILRLQEAFDKKFKQAMREQTILDLNDPSLKEKVAEQIRSQVVDEYLNDLPEEDKSGKDKLKANLINAMGQDPEFLEAQRKLMGSAASAEKESEKREYKLRGTDHNGNKYVIRVTTDGALEINRNVNDKWEVVSDTGWFEYNALEMDLLNPPGEPGSQSAEASKQAGERQTVKPTPIEVKPDAAEEEGVDVEAMESSMKRIEELNKQLAALITDPEKVAEAAIISQQLKEEMNKMRKIWEAAPVETIGGESETVVMDPEQAQEIIDKRKHNIFKRAWDKMRGKKEESKSIPVAGAAVIEKDTKSEKDRRTVAGVVVGGLLVGGTALVTWYLTKQGHSPDVTNNIINNFCDGGKHAWENRPGGGGHGQTILENLPKGIHYEDLRVHNGNWHDTIWTHIQSKTTDGGDVNKNVQQVLNMNSKAIMQHAQPGENLWQAAHHLPEHFKFKVPNRFGN